MSLKAVYDTNVVVSANVNPGGLPASLVALALGKQVRLFYSPAILEEYEEVLKRPKFGFTPQVVDLFLRDLRAAGEMVRPTQKLSASPHEPDNRFVECAQAARADYLLTGNTKHFPFPEFAGTKIVTPAEFARVVAQELYAQGQSKLGE
jgi:putative PIN family toxin of toxin-antitoxin system